MTGTAAFAEAALAAALVAIDPIGLGGAVLRSGHGPVRDLWLAELSRLFPTGTPIRRVPASATDESLLGGLDLTATLDAGRPIFRRGLFAETHGGLALLAMAERIGASGAARLAAVLDLGSVTIERDGFAGVAPAAFAVVALDEGIDGDERTPAALRERLAFHLDLGRVSMQEAAAFAVSPADVVAARARLGTVTLAADIVEALTAAAAALGIGSLRAPAFALRAARAIAALDGRTIADADDAALAARLVLAPRATVAPASVDDSTDEADRAADEPREGASDGDAGRKPEDARPIEDVVLEAARAAIPADLLARLIAGGVMARGRGADGSSGALSVSGSRGRPAGVRPGVPGRGARLSLVETLRAAAPWQRLRRSTAGEPAAADRKVLVRKDDFRIRRYRQRRGATTIFGVDASGSAALHRLAEAKGAVELLLADCYVRRDSVALVAFRGRGAELLLPPTRSLVRAKRSLAGLPGGGGTPLATGIELVVTVADAVRRRGGTPVVVLLTDGQANVGRDGKGGRKQAGEDAMAAAAALRTRRLAALLIDTAPQPQPAAARIAAAMDARYLALPHADARLLSRAVRAATETIRPSAT